jgi:hypothetical protein
MMWQNTHYMQRINMMAALRSIKNEVYGVQQEVKKQHL